MNKNETKTCTKLTRLNSSSRNRDMMMFCFCTLHQISMKVTGPKLHINSTPETGTFFYGVCRILQEFAEKMNFCTLSMCFITSFAAKSMKNHQRIERIPQIRVLRRRMTEMALDLSRNMQAQGLMTRRTTVETGIYNNYLSFLICFHRTSTVRPRI